MAYNNNQRTDNGSNPQAVQNGMEITRAGMSYFDESMVHTTTGDVGALIPMDVFKCYIGDRLELKTSFFIDCLNPMVRPMLSRVRAYVHYYYSRATDLWEGYQNFLTTGRQGNINKTLPYVNSSNGLTGTMKDASGNFTQNIQMTTPMSLASYLGFGWNVFPKQLNGTHAQNVIYPYGLQENLYRTLPYIRLFTPDSDESVISNWTYTLTAPLNALPFAMYQRIYRDYYLNKNLSQNNKNWFPDNEDRWIMDYETTNARTVTGLGNREDNFTPTSITVENYEDQTKNDEPVLGMLRYRQYRGDYFTEALPWQYRGQEPTMTSWTQEVWNNGTTHEIQAAETKSGATRLVIQRIGSQDNGEPTSYTQDNVPSTGGLGFGLRTAYTANQIRELFVMAEWKERMAKTNGDYNQMMLAQYGENPHIHDRVPTYIGGCAVDLNTSVVTQTSGDSQNSILGEQGGRMSAICNANIGNFRCPDNGFVMAILSIVPDVTYNPQGIPREMKGNITMAEEMFPLFNNLAPQGITESEITRVSPESDTKLWGWQERFANLKYRRNRNSGLIGLPPDQAPEYATRTWARNFRYYVPSLNNAFVTMAPPNVRRDMFTAPTEPMFLIQFASRIGAVRHLPYKQEAAGLKGYGM